jgi:hypothetical protein
MKISRDAALKILRKWESDSSLLKICCGSWEFGSASFGRVKSVSTEFVEFTTPDDGSYRVSFRDAVFGYAEPGEAEPGEVSSEDKRLSEEADCVGQLKLFWSPTSRCVIFEMRPPS